MAKMTFTTTQYIENAVNNLQRAHEIKRLKPNRVNIFIFSYTEMKKNRKRMNDCSSII